MSNEFVARKGLVVKTVITGETETNVLVKNTSGLVKANPQSNFVTNIDDTWTSTDKIYYIVTLRQSEYDAIGTKDPNTLYVIIVEPSATPSVTPAPSATPSVTPSISVSITPSVTPSITPSPSQVIQKYIIGGTATAPYVSINSGGSWTALDTTGFSNPRAAATPRSYLYKNHMIGTGSTHMCVVGYLSNSSRLWMTHNGGSTWTYSGFSNCTLEWIHTTPGNGNWYSAGWTYNLYQTSFNNGYTWTGRTMPTVGALNFSGSKNGQYVYAGTGNVAGTRRIQRSSNYGATFAYDSGAITTGGNGHLVVECDDTGQYVAAYYGGNGTTSCGMNWSSNYGASFTKLQTVGCLAGMFPDMSLAFYVQCTNGRFYYSTNSGSTWVYISLPDSWTWAGLSYSRTYKHIYINQSAVSPKVYKLNDAKNGWDLFYSGATNTNGSVGCSELTDEITICLATSYNMYKVNQSGTATLIYTGTSSRAAPSIV